MPEKLFSGNACVSWDIFASDSGRIAGSAEAAGGHEAIDLDLELERRRVDERQRGERVRGRDGVGAAEKCAAGFQDNVGRRRRQLRPHRDSRDLLDDFRDDGHELAVFSDIGSHVLAVHVGTRQVQLERVAALVLARGRQRLPVPQLRLVAGARHDRGDQGVTGKRLLDAPQSGTHQSSVLSEMSSQFQEECSAAPGRFLIERCDDSASARRNIVFGTHDVDDRVQADGLGHHAGPARPRTRAGYSIRTRSAAPTTAGTDSQTNAGERRRQIGHGSSLRYYR